MEQSDILQAGGFTFVHRFDSGNLGHVERVPSEQISPSLNYKTNNLETPDFEFNIWTRPDCYGTEFENGNRTWFYFGIQGGQTNALVRLNIINLNKQGKMYSQGMAPVTRTLPGEPHWERIKDHPVHSTDDNTFTLSFKYRTPEDLKATTFFAFTYPFSFTELQNSLTAIDQKFLPLSLMQSLDDIYYVRENVIYTLEGRRTDLLTISSYHGITNEREDPLKNLFPDGGDRPFKFNKKVIFISARVHPGETPSSFVFNGLLNLLLSKTDPVAVQLRRLYVFKLIPFLNPDGVARGHYRTDTRGVNLNRVYLNPSLEHHPTVYAARVLIRYYHFGVELDDVPEEPKSEYRSFSRTVPSVDDKMQTIDPKKKSPLRPKENTKSTVALRRQNAAKSACSDAATSTSNLVVQVSRASSTGELTAQVCDLKLKETREQLSQTILSMESCDQLGHTGAEECTHGKTTSTQVPDPLRHLRDSLKNNIGLRMGGSVFHSSTSDILNKGDSLLGWCRDCKDTIDLQGKRSDDPSLVNSPDSPRLVTEDLKAPSAFCINSKDTIPVQSEPEVLPSESISAASSCDRCDMTPPSSEQSSVERPTTIITIENKTKPPTPKPRKRTPVRSGRPERRGPKEPDSGLFLYVDMHGHASKKGIFMYGNHFDDLDSAVECTLLPRLMSLNNEHFHFSSCNFTERNMYLKDRRDGMSREGSGRVAVLKATGLIRSYTLECNYNTGRLVNVLPPTTREPPPTLLPATPPSPPKYTPHIFEEVGRALGASILDLTGHNPYSRVPASEHRTLAGVREWLRTHTNGRTSQLTVSRLRPTKSTSPTRAPLYARPPKSKMADVERKENTYIGAKPEDSKKPFKKAEKAFGKARVFAESEPKPKSLSAKKRNILAIRKPNAVKSRSASSKTKAGKSEAGPAPVARPKATFSRFRRAKPSSSSEELASTCEPSCSAAKRRPFPPPPAAPRLKKIRLKTTSQVGCDPR